MDFTQIVMALVVGLPATIAAIGGLLQGLRTSRKVDENTELTKKVKEAAEVAVQQTNGAMDARISRIVKLHTEPLVIAFREHNDQDEKNMKEIRHALESLSNK